MRIAWRLFWKSRGLAALAVSTLGVALALGAALASVADAILLRPLPVDDPERVVRIFTPSAADPLGLVSYPDYGDYRRGSRMLAGMVAQSQVLIAAGDSPAEVRLGLAVSTDYFDVLGVRLAPGRGFRPVESRDAVVVLARSYWESRFAADPRIIGSTLRLSGRPFTIIGVAPRGFGLDRFTHEDFYVPAGVYAAGLLPAAGHPLTDRARRYLNVYARLAPGATREQARAEIDGIGRRLETQYPDADQGRRALTLSEWEARTRTDRTMPALAALLAGLAALLLGIGWANIAVLLLARREARGKEIAIRIAVGASPGRLFRESLIESAALAIAGLGLAMPLARAATTLLARVATLPTDLSFAIDPRIDARVAGIAVGAAAMAAVLGAVPARPSAQWRQTLAALEIAVATAALACAGSLLAGVAAAERIDPGYRIDHVLTIAIDPAQSGENEAQARVFYRQALDRVVEMRGARRATLAQSVPLGFTGAQRQIAIDGEPSTVWMNIVGTGYFELMHLPILAGRGFEDADSADAPAVAVVNQELAKRCGVGCTFRMNSHTVRVIGVARTAKYFQIGEHPRPYFYLPFAQNYASRMVLHLETQGNPAALARAVSNALHRIDATQTLSEIRPLESYLTQGAMFQARVGLRVLAGVGLAAMGLALAGVYAIVSHAATRRRREIGIRIALGAGRGRVLWAVGAGAAGSILSGTGLGVALALAASRVLAALVRGASLDVMMLCGSAAVILLVSAPAWLMPAWKAATVDSTSLLRAE